MGIEINNAIIFVNSSFFKRVLTNERLNKVFDENVFKESKELSSLNVFFQETIELKNPAKQNIALVKLNTTTHEEFYVVYYYTYIIILLIHVFQTQNPICNVIPAIIVNLPNVTLVRKEMNFVSLLS